MALPLHRTFTSLGYFHHDNDYFTDMDRPFVDLWDTMVLPPKHQFNMPALWLFCQSWMRPLNLTLSSGGRAAPGLRDELLLP